MKKIICIAISVMMLAGAARVSAQEQETGKEKQRTERKADKQNQEKNKDKQAPGQNKEKQNKGQDKDKQAGLQNDGQQKPDRPQGSTEDMARNRADRMKEQLSLSDDQYGKILDLNKAQAEQRANAPRPSREEMQNMTDEQKSAMRDEMKKSRDEYNAKLKGILSAEQYAKYEENMKNARGGGESGQRPQGASQDGQPKQKPQGEKPGQRPQTAPQGEKPSDSNE